MPEQEQSIDAREASLSIEKAVRIASQVVVQSGKGRGAVVIAAEKSDGVIEGADFVGSRRRQSRGGGGHDPRRHARRGRR